MSALPPDPIQPLLWPETGIIPEPDLFARLDGPAHFVPDGPGIVLPTGATASFDTATNLFNLAKWRRCCALGALGLHLQGTGMVVLRVHHHTAPDSTPARLEVRIDLAHSGPTDLAPLLDDGSAGVLHFSLTALGAARLDSGAWTTHQPRRRVPDLALSMTTYLREAQVRASVARFERFVATSPLADHLHMIVVDNGGTADIATTRRVTAIANPNLGGSGGFARGLIEARARAATHCIFMDDDAAIQMSVITRTWYFLAHATDPATAIAGGLTRAEPRWLLWENGATFRLWCRPRFHGTDLRDFAQCLRMELEGAGPSAPGDYGGWWFFAFPIAGLRFAPFPFFVRGDDISFSLSNGFDTVTLPGLLCYPDADFPEKETLQTIYLELRSHLVHHLAHPHMDEGLLRSLFIPVWFYMRSLMQCHYDTLAALTLSLRDASSGPAFFAADADLALRRTTLATLYRTEAFKPLSGPPPATRLRIDPQGTSLRARLWRLVLNVSLNGHLLPFFGYWGNHVTIPAALRGNVHAVSGAARITYLRPDGTAFTVRHSKIASLRAGAAFCRALGAFALRYHRIRRDWRAGFGLFASESFWSARIAQAEAERTKPAP